MKKIAIVMPVKNGAATLERALRSLDQQTCRDFGVIFIDGASTDGTQDIVHTYAHLVDYFSSAPDSGPFAAAQKGLMAAARNGYRLIGFLMADDRLSPDAVECLARAHDEGHPDLVGFDVQCHGNSRNRFCAPQWQTRESAMYCHALGFFYSRRLIDEEGYFDTGLFPRMAERDMLLRVSKYRYACIPKILYHFLEHPGSNSTGGGPLKKALMLEETARIALHHLRHAPDAASRWYCFNMWRAAWFRLKIGQPRVALGHIAGMLLRFPVHTVRTLVRWRIPEAYRPL